ncbi:MAG: bifunctional phosphopantothenoylcysteine decarboxylase/phosphopantothenate--cysteine ligase CoaBC [Coriobacteriia bacterium]|nr:bifunctional phosphopantothenoylcysteine decarboxylase/phosphopantothenate--cysteine ligase CoaBC [Coriobacteriia bacterium]
MESKQKTVLLGVTGCIAAYKACEVLRLLQKADVNVKVVMTPSGAEFVTPTTFRALSQNEVAVEAIADANTPIHHISLAQEPDVFLIAPATANTINKLAAGIADNLLTTTALATEAPIIIAPAMNVHMWRDPSTQAALEVLRSRGIEIIAPEVGYLACGDIGEGKLATVEDIAERTLVELNRCRDLEGKTMLITAGPTREYLDPVRFISSPSSGLTGYLIAGEAARRGADVYLVSGPCELPDPFDVNTIRITSAEEMFAACNQIFDEKHPNAAIFSAAVADFRPATIAEQKLKKGTDLPATAAQGEPSGETGATSQAAVYSLDLIANPDILYSISQRKGDCFVVGFAAESENIIENGMAKLHAKGADMIIANDVSNPEIGFATEDNRWQLLSESGAEDTGTQSKRALAGVLLDKVASRIN